LSKQSVTSKLIDLICRDREPICQLAVMQLVETMNKTCSECQADRRVLLLDPLCNGRFYLSLLVEASLPINALPRDCYKIRLEEIKKILLGKPVPVPTSDSVIKLKDFLRILADITGDKETYKKIGEVRRRDDLIAICRELLSKLKSKVSLGDSLTNNFLCIIYSGDTPIICLIDFERRIVYVNLQYRKPFLSILRELSTLLLRDYGLHGDVLESSMGNTYLEIEIDTNFDHSSLESYGFSGLVSILARNGKKILLIRVMENGSPVLSYSKILDIIRFIGEKHGEKQ